MGLSSREVEDKRFSVSRRGFDKDEVVAYLGQVGKQMSLTEQQLAITEAKAARTQQELDRLNDVLETRIAEAQQARDAILEEARREAAQMREAGGDAAAARTAGAIVAEAETKAELRLAEVDTILESARADADRMRKDAEYDAGLKVAEAERIVDVARREARKMHQDTEKERTDIEATLRELRRILMAAEAAGGDADEVNVIVRNEGEIVVDLSATPVNQPATDS